MRRSVWRTHVGETKTDESTAAVPVIAPLREVLEDYKRRTKTDGFIFAGPKRGFALNLDNLTKREIRTVLGERWHGWHAFRRGIATNLYKLGVPPKVIQGILRHAPVETTQHHYVVIEQQAAGRKAMRQPGAAIRRANIGKDVANSKRASRNS